MLKTLAVILIPLGIFCSEPARAAFSSGTGYPCNVQLIGQYRSSSMGVGTNSPAVTVDYYSMPGCVGTHQGSITYTTITTSSSNWYETYSYTTEEFYALFRNLSMAAIRSVKTQWFGITKFAGGPVQGYRVTFGAP